jgi:hypothetical protein
MAYDIQPLPSEYAGQRFRSRLEARFAYYFDLLEIQWEYEPEGFALPSRNYCPDFLCNNHFYVEVRPDGTSFCETSVTLAELCLATRKEVYFMKGLPQTNRVVSGRYYDDMLYAHAEGFRFDLEPDGSRKVDIFGETTYIHNERAFWHIPHVQRMCESIFCHYAFIKKGWGCPFYGCEHYASDDDLTALTKARRLRFDRQGRAEV